MIVYLGYVCVCVCCRNFFLHIFFFFFSLHVSRGHADTLLWRCTTEEMHDGRVINSGGRYRFRAPLRMRAFCVQPSKMSVCVCVCVCVCAGVFFLYYMRLRYIYYSPLYTVVSGNLIESELPRQDGDGIDARRSHFLGCAEIFSVFKCKGECSSEI